MKTAMEELIEYAEKILEHSNINAHLIITKAKELQGREAKVKNLAQPDVSGNEALRVAACFCENYGSYTFGGVKKCINCGKPKAS
jgi:hypothetical protein